MVSRLLRAIVVGIGTGTAHIITHFVSGDPSAFDQAGVLEAGLVVTLVSALLAYLFA